MSSEQTKLHNELAGQIVGQIVRPVIESGGSYTEVLVLLESVILGVMLMAVKLGGDEIVFDTVVERVKQRLAECRLRHVNPAGTA